MGKGPQALGTPQRHYKVWPGAKPRNMSMPEKGSLLIHQCELIRKPLLVKLIYIYIYIYIYIFNTSNLMTDQRNKYINRVNVPVDCGIVWCLIGNFDNYSIIFLGINYRTWKYSVDCD